MADSKAGEQYTVSSSAAPAEALEKPPPYAAAMQVNSTKLRSNKDPDIEAGLVQDYKIQERIKLRHKIIILTLLGVSTLATCCDLGEPKDNRLGKLRKDYFGEIENNSKLKIAGAIAAVIWFALMFYAVVKETYCLLRFGRFMQVIVFIMCCLMIVLAMVIQPLRIIFLTIACIFNGFIINSMSYLIRSIERT